MNSTDEANLIAAEPLPRLGRQPSKGSRLISKVLSPAIQLWLRTQVEAITGLKFQIWGSDREILRGCVPRVEVQAEQVVYQGLHLSQIDLSASQIQINLGQVLQGKPLRLLEVVPVVGTVRLKRADLDASMSAPLMKQALADFLLLVLHHLDEELPPDMAAVASRPIQLEQPQIQLLDHGFILTADWFTPHAQPAQLKLETELRLAQGSQLAFTALKLHYISLNQPITVTANQPLVIDLGAEVHLDKLEIAVTGVLSQGRINVTSAA
jgi:hypothetical protein